MNNPKSKIRNLKSRQAFTLVEVLIAAALSLVLVGLVVQVFATVGNTATQTRSVVQMTDRLRTARIILANDLSNITVDMTKIPLRKELNQGYFEYIEGPDGPIFPGLSGVPVAVDMNQIDPTTGAPVADSTVGDPDDVLMFTANASSGTFFYGRMRAGSSVVDAPGPTGRVWPMPVDTTAQASSAEICYFMRGDTLYRRQLLIRPPTDWSITNGQIDPTVYLWSQYPTFISAGTSSLLQPIWDIAFYDKFDLSARQSGGSYDMSNALGGTKPPVLIPNTLGDLTARQNRYGHQPWVYPFDARFWDARNWVVPATYLPAGGFLGLPTLRECSGYTGALGSASGVARWPFPLFDASSALSFTAGSVAGLPAGVTVTGTIAKASANLWGVPVSYIGGAPAPGVTVPVFPYSNPNFPLPLIYPYPVAYLTSIPLPPPETLANFQTFPTTLPGGTTTPGAWTGRINLTNVNGGQFDLWRNPYPLDQQDVTAAPRTGALYAFSSAFQPNNEVNVNFSTRYADDILLTHVLSFDVKAWDPTAPTIQTNAVFGGIPAGTYMPGDPGYTQIIAAWAGSGVATLQSNLQPMQLTPGQPTGAYGGYGFTVAQGAYVDLNYLGPVILPFLTSNIVTAQALANVSTFAGPGVAQFGKDFSQGSGLGMVYDTGCFDYENDGIDQNQNGVIDDFTNGLDDNGIGGVDDLTEVEAAMPYPTPLKGIQIKIRVYDPSSRQIREVTLTQDFL